MTIQEFFAENNGIAGVVRPNAAQLPHTLDIPIPMVMALRSDIPDTKNTQNLETLFHDTRSLQYAFDEKGHSGKIHGQSFERYRHMGTENVEKCNCSRPNYNP